MNGPTSSIPVATPDPVKASAGSETMADRATRLLEDAIVRLDLPPGMRITENELALRFGLGRTPVREAVQRLVADGLLVVFPRKGMTVGVINPLDVLLALDVRGPVERVVAVSAARRATPAQRDALLRAGQGMEEAAAAGDSVTVYAWRQGLRHADRHDRGQPLCPAGPGAAAIHVAAGLVLFPARPRPRDHGGASCRPRRRRFPGRSRCCRAGVGRSHRPHQGWFEAGAGGTLGPGACRRIGFAKLAISAPAIARGGGLLHMLARPWS